MTTGMESLGSQAWGGGNMSLLGLWFKRGVVITLLTSIPSLLLCVRMDLILILIGLDPDLAAATGVYMRWAIPYAIFYAIFLSFEKFVLVQQKFTAYYLIVLIMFPVHILFSYTFISVYHLGLAGAALALASTFLFGNIIYILYIGFSSQFIEIIFPLFSKSIFSDWRIYIQIGIGGVWMYVPALWGIMLISVHASYLGSEFVAANAILQNIYFCLYAACVGSFYSTSILVGNSIGAGTLQPLSTILKAAFTFSVLFTLLLNGGLFIFRRQYFGLYTTNKDILELSLSIVPYLILANILRQIFLVLEGMMRGCGEQKRAGRTNFVTYLLILQPLAYVFAFPLGLQLKGLWIAFDISLLIVQLWYIINVVTLDMPNILLTAQERLNIED